MDLENRENRDYGESRESKKINENENFYNMQYWEFRGQRGNS